MRSIAYVSRAAVEWTDDDLAGLLAKSQQRNIEDAVSGLLIYCQGYFLQVVEGPHENISNLMERVAADPRHTDVKQIADQTYPRPTDFSNIESKRMFPQWSMGFENVKSETLVHELLTPAVEKGLISHDLVREVLVERFLTNQTV